MKKRGLLILIGAIAIIAIMRIIMFATVLLFLGGLYMLLKAPQLLTENGKIDGTTLVAVITPVLTAIGTVAAGVFGYSLGSEGAAEAQKTASQAQQVANTATQEAAEANQEAKDATKEAQEAATKTDAAVPLVRTVERILNQQALVQGKPTASGKYEISLDDLRTITEEGREVSRKLGI